MPDRARPGIDYVRRHLRVGWWSLFAFAAFGLLLESFHGLKLGAYLDAGNATRRLMWTLAHAHGALLGLVHVAFALTVQRVIGSASPALPLISTSLLAATLLIPGGFFLGGVRFYAGDPGLGILLVPAGAVLLLLALAQIARGSKTPSG